MSAVSAPKSPYPYPTSKRALEVDDKASLGISLSPPLPHTHYHRSRPSNGNTEIHESKRRQTGRANTDHRFYGDVPANEAPRAGDALLEELLTPLIAQSDSSSRHWRPKANTSGRAQSQSDPTLDGILPVVPEQPGRDEMRAVHDHEAHQAAPHNAQSEAESSGTASSTSGPYAGFNDHLFYGLDQFGSGRGNFSPSRDATTHDWAFTAGQDIDLTTAWASDPTSFDPGTAPYISSETSFDNSVFPEQDQFQISISQPEITFDPADPSTWTHRPLWLLSENDYPYDISGGASVIPTSLSPKLPSSPTVDLSLGDSLPVDAHTLDDNEYLQALLSPTDSIFPFSRDRNLYVPSRSSRAGQIDNISQIVDVDESLSSANSHSIQIQDSTHRNYPEHGYRRPPGVRPNSQKLARPPVALERHQSSASPRIGPSSVWSDEKSYIESHDDFSEVSGPDPYSPAHHEVRPMTGFSKAKSQKRSGLPFRQHKLKSEPSEDVPWSISQSPPRAISFSKADKVGSSVFVVREDNNETRPELIDFLKNQNKTFKGPGSSLITPNQTPEKLVELQWEHMFAVSEPAEIKSTPVTQSARTQKIGKRQGQLATTKRIKTAGVRKAGACWNCRIMKLECTEDRICERCRTAASSPITGAFCCRVRFKDYTDLFFPAPAVGMFRRQVVEKVVTDQVRGFTDNKFRAYFSVGPTYPAIPLVIHEYHPSDVEFLAMHKIHKDDASQTSSFATCYTPPLGLLELGTEVKNACLEHVKNVIKGERNFGEVYYGQTSQFEWDVFEAVTRYYRATKNPLVRKALMVYSMSYFMTRTLTFTDASAEEVIRQLKRPTQFRYKEDQSARLVNRQVKVVMYELLHEFTAELLDGLEKEIKASGKSHWGTCLCVILILCMYAEMVQVSADVRIVRKMMTKPLLGVTRDDSIDLCRKLDEIPMAQCINIFHGLHRTSKPKVGPRNEHGFNPIRDGLKTGEYADINDETVDMVADMREIVGKYRNQLDDLAQAPLLTSFPDPLTNHMDFRLKNSGRLVAKFLRSFL